MKKYSVGHVACCLFVILLSLAWLLIAKGGTAFAQAEAVKSNPGPNVTVQTMPGLVTITTSENIKADPAGSNIFVYGPHGKLVSQGDAQVTASSMSVPIKNDGEGAYVVQWKTISAKDGGTAQGAFTFTFSTEQNNIPLLAIMLTGILMLGMGILMGYGLGQRKASLAAQSLEGSKPE